MDILVQMKRRNSFAFVACAVLGTTLGAQSSALSNDLRGQSATATASDGKSPARTVDAGPEDSKSLEPIEHPLEYPTEAKEKGIQGKVVLKVSISEAGIVESAEGVNGDPILTKAAIAAVKQWKFKPFIKNGKAVRVLTNLPVNFALPSQSRPTTVEPVKIVKAIYPKKAEQEEIQGQVVIRAFLNENGDVGKMEVVDSTDAVFNQSAFDAVKQWKFKPYFDHGKAVPVAVKLPVDFALPDNIVDKRSWADEYNKDEPTQDPSKRPHFQAGARTIYLIHRVDPVYPWQAKNTHTQGLVQLHAIIGKEGRIEDLKVVSGDHALVKAAIGAVRQWRYEPYSVDGEPLEIDTDIEVHFALGIR